MELDESNDWDTCKIPFACSIVLFFARGFWTSINLYLWVVIILSLLVIGIWLNSVKEVLFWAMGHETETIVSSWNYFSSVLLKGSFLKPNICMEENTADWILNASHTRSIDCSFSFGLWEGERGLLRARANSEQITADVLFSCFLILDLSFVYYFSVSCMKFQLYSQILQRVS